MKKWILIVMTLALVSACGNEQQSAQPSHKDEKSTTHKQDSAETKKASKDNQASVSYTHLTLPTKEDECRSRWSPYH